MSNVWPSRYKKSKRLKEIGDQLYDNRSLLQQKRVKTEHLRGRKVVSNFEDIVKTMGKKTWRGFRKKGDN